MGWFESSKGSGLILGDEPLDITHRYLRELATLYQQGCRRKPTLAEVVALLESGLKFSGSDCVGDLEERAVVQVVVKTRKKPRDQRYQVGDIFAVPVTRDLFAFGRYMYDGGTGGMLVEVFRTVASARGFSRSVIESGRLFGPVVAGGSVDRALKSWRWTVVANDPSYTISRDDLETEFASPAPHGRGWCASRFQSNEWREIDDKQAKLMEDGAIRGADYIERRIRKDLGLREP
jgi:hypothetical protein